VSGDFINKYEVSIHEPWKEFDVYQPLASKEPGFTAESGQFISILLDIQKYHRVSRPGDECIDDAEQTRRFSQVIKKVLS
jgi:hypothetical protein